MENIEHLLVCIEGLNGDEDCSFPEQVIPGGEKR